MINKFERKNNEGDELNLISETEINKDKTKNKSPFKLDGLKALVTGASRGIGKEIAISLAEAGASVAVNYRSSEEGAASVAQTIEAKGVSSWIYPADISEYLMLYLAVLLFKIKSSVY